MYDQPVQRLLAIFRQPHTAERGVPAGVMLEHYDDQGRLRYFNPDREGAHRMRGRAQILIFCHTPERQRRNKARPSSIRYDSTAAHPP